MGVVLCRRERGRAGHAAEQEGVRRGGGDRRKRMDALHEELGDLKVGRCRLDCAPQ